MTNSDIHADYEFRTTLSVEELRVLRETLHLAKGDVIITHRQQVLSNLITKTFDDVVVL